MSDLWDYPDEVEDEIEQPVATVDPPASPDIAVASSPPKLQEVVDLLEDEDEDYLEILALRHAKKAKTACSDDVTVTLNVPSAPTNTSTQLDPKVRKLLEVCDSDIAAFRATANLTDADASFPTGRPALSTLNTSIRHRRPIGSSYLQKANAPPLDFIPQFIDSSSIPCPEYSAAEPQVSTITLKFKASMGDREISVSCDKPLSEAFQQFRTFAEGKGWVKPGQDIKFRFDGDVIAPDSTAASLDLEDKDMIDVIFSK